MPFTCSLCRCYISLRMITYICVCPWIWSNLSMWNYFFFHFSLRSKARCDVCGHRWYGHSKTGSQRSCRAASHTLWALQTGQTSWLKQIFMFSYVSFEIQNGEQLSQIMLKDAIKNAINNKNMQSFSIFQTCVLLFIFFLCRLALTHPEVFLCMDLQVVEKLCWPKLWPITLQVGHECRS